MSSFTWWRNPDTGLSRRPSLGDRSPRLRAGRRGRQPHHQRGRNPRYGVSREARVNQLRPTTSTTTVVLGVDRQFQMRSSNHYVDQVMVTDPLPPEVASVTVPSSATTSPFPPLPASEMAELPTV